MMEERKYRCHFAITDSMGEILYSSSHNIISEGENLLSRGILSESDTSRFEETRRNQSFDSFRLFENKNNGKAIFIITSLFPSTRAFIALFTDIDFSAAKLFFSERFIFEKKGISRAEKEKLSSLSVLMDNCFHSNFSSSRISSKKTLTSSLTDLAFLSASEANISCLPLMPRCFKDFDSEFFCLFALSALCAASVFSDSRKACISVTEERLRIKIKIEFEKSESRTSREKEKLLISDRFEKLFSYLHSVADRKNIPFSVLKLPDFCLEIIPYSLDFALMGIKEPQKRLTFFKLKKEQENEEKKS